MEFACSLCTYKSSQKIDVYRHISKIKQCRLGDKHIVTLYIDVLCDLCGCSFVNTRALKHHQKTSCKISALEKEIMDLKTANNNITNIINVNNNTTDNNITDNDTTDNDNDTTDNINIYINIKNNINDTSSSINSAFYINYYDEKNLTKLTDEDFYNIMKESDELYKIIPRLVNDIHFNPKIPQNHNIYNPTASSNGKHIRVYRNDTWEIVDKHEEIENLIRDKEINLNDWFEKGDIKCRKFLKRYKEYVAWSKEEDNLNIVKKTIEYMLYNKKNIAINTSKLIGKLKIKNNQTNLLYLFN